MIVAGLQNGRQIAVYIRIKPLKHPQLLEERSGKNQNIFVSHCHNGGEDSGETARKPENSPALRRNPWNEIECGEHYGRALASSGVFTAACGFESHGPKGHITFALRLTPEHCQRFHDCGRWGGTAQRSDGETLNAETKAKTPDKQLKKQRIRTTNPIMKASAEPKTQILWIGIQNTGSA
jgi:hypothetical protein